MAFFFRPVLHCSVRERDHLFWSKFELSMSNWVSIMRINMNVRVWRSFSLVYWLILCDISAWNKEIIFFVCVFEYFSWNEDDRFSRSATLTLAPSKWVLFCRLPTNRAILKGFLVSLNTDLQSFQNQDVSHQKSTCDRKSDCRAVTSVYVKISLSLILLPRILAFHTPIHLFRLYIHTWMLSNCGARFTSSSFD